MPKGLKKLFEGVDGLSDSFITEAEQIMEARVQSVVGERLQEASDAHVAEINALKETHATKLNDAQQLVEAAKGEAVDSIVESVDQFLDQKVNEWATENAAGIDSRIKLNLSESLLTGISELMKEHNIVVPEGSDTLIEAQEQEINELTEKCNSLMAESMEHKTSEKTKLVEGVISAVCEGLADTQIDTVRSLVEGVEYKDEAAYRMRVESAKKVVEGKDWKDGDKKEDGDDDKKDGTKKEGEKKQVDEAVVVDESGKPLNEGAGSGSVNDVMAFLTR